MFDLKTATIVIALYQQHVKGGKVMLKNKISMFIWQPRNSQKQ